MKQMQQVTVEKKKIIKLNTLEIILFRYNSGVFSVCDSSNKALNTILTSLNIYKDTV